MTGQRLQAWMLRRLSEGHRDGRAKGSSVTLSKSCYHQVIKTFMFHRAKTVKEAKHQVLPAHML